MNELSKDSANWEEVGESGANQRIDNYLCKRLKGVPKSHIYRIVRSGEVRVNSRRVAPTYRLRIGDRLRLPPLRFKRPAQERYARPLAPRLAQAVIYEDEALVVLDKPAGMAAHGGSGIARGVIEQLRQERPQAKFLELVHRLDRDTSGILLLAKKRSALTALHEQIRAGRVRKQYLVLVRGRWRGEKHDVKLPLTKHVLASGERRVTVDRAGRPAHTVFTLRKRVGGFSLLEAELKTGRTHQIRVQLAHLGYPIAGDDKYGDFDLNRRLAKAGLKRMFLHACELACGHPRTGARLVLRAPLPAELQAFLDGLEQTTTT
ncbi:MAG: RluA family pseudouridine synthase [Betaproteobacteria bacterium]|nr:RluA family pseudouridine synthase [Betaproteobacteria bacterium]